MTLDESSLHLKVLSEVRQILISRYTVTRWHLRERPPYCAPLLCCRCHSHCCSKVVFLKTPIMLLLSYLWQRPCYVLVLPLTEALLCMYIRIRMSHCNSVIVWFDSLFAYFGSYPKRLSASLNMYMFQQSSESVVQAIMGQKPQC